MLLLHVLVPQVLHVELLLLGSSPRLLEALLELLLVLVLVLAQWRGLLAGLGARQTGERLVLVGLAERVWREPLV